MSDTTTTTTTINHAYEYATDLGESLDELMARYAGDEHDDECEIRVCTDDSCDNECGTVDECECTDRARNELDERPLELVAEIGEPYAILLTFGGPNAWIVWEARQGTAGARLDVYWGGDTSTRRSAGIQAMAEYFAEIMTGE